VRPPTPVVRTLARADDAGTDPLNPNRIARVPFDLPDQVFHKTSSW
jgi:hypothetical protein